MIHNIDIEKFYKKIDKHVKLASIVSNYKNLPTLIKICRLKPSTVFGEKKFDFNSHFIERWDDEFGNSLVISKGSIKLELDCVDARTGTDLFYGRSIKKLLPLTEKIIVVEWEYENIIALYGRDEYLRCFSVADNEQKKLVPLKLGLELLISIVNGLGSFGIKELGEGVIIFPYPSKKDISSFLKPEIVRTING